MSSSSYNHQDFKRECPLCKPKFTSLFVEIDVESVTYRTLHLSKDVTGPTINESPTVAAAGKRRNLANPLVIRLCYDFQYPTESAISTALGASATGTGETTIIDTRPNGDALRKCILKGPYKLTTVTIPAVHVTDDTPTVPERTSVETLLTMSHENKAHYESKKEAIHLLLSRIEDEIYSTVDACKTFRKFTSHDGDSMESHYSRFYKMMNEMIINNLTVGTMQVNVQILQQLQPEWSSYQRKFNEICDKNTNNATPLALVADASPYPDHYYQAPKSHKPYAPTSKQSSSTRSNASNKFKGKEIAKPITPPSELASKEDSDLEQAKRDKDMQKNLALIVKYFKKIYKPTNNNLRTFSNSRNKNVDTSPRYVKDNQTRQFRNKRTVTVLG
ncbi:hypothetical protein Tco_0016372 [Tanacetum coccineum]